MMVSFFAGLCELCGEARPMATPEQCKAAGLEDANAAVCVDCVARALGELDTIGKAVVESRIRAATKKPS